MILRSKFWYVYSDGTITDEVDNDALGFICVVDAVNLKDATQQAHALGWINQPEETDEKDSHVRSGRNLI